MGFFWRDVHPNNIETLRTPRPFNGVTAYAQTKRAMAVLSHQMADRLKESGISVHCMHPGWASTPGVESHSNFWRLTKPILRTSEGADTIVWLSVCNKAPTPGLYWFDRKPGRLHLYPAQTAVAEEDNFWNIVHEWASINPYDGSQHDHRPQSN